MHIRQKHPELRYQFVLYHNNAQSHVTRVVQEWLELQGIELMPHLSYSLDLAPCDFWLFPTLIRSLHDQHFKSDAEVVQTVNQVFQHMSPGEFAKTIMYKWAECLNICLEARRHYFEMESTLHSFCETDSESE